ncbi:hypothetical protein B9G69_001305 [Bdellovibrio sp. SKB1291214]|uniref:hypothetical protein n=1 Tax=Bdellovibrio sp. SKB1291214 TaxID=1732569 RepID=UPI000B51CDC7|nr:hypothetical protein [Bdellovibrio sp. SKB1291214]UYL09213.1 hypothetical protein B9G69_001305 [Bdellovibrio sp. SKB1291214]
MMNALLSLSLLLFLNACAQKAPAPMDLPKYDRLINVPLTSKYWTVAFDGGGEVKFNVDGSGDLVFHPQVAKTSLQTFSSLLLLKNTVTAPVNNYVVKMEVTTVRQLRSSTPNDWEVFWFVSNYRKDPQLIKTANYFIQKPNSGIELGRFFEETGQKFLMTSEQSTKAVGLRSTYYFAKQGQRFRVFRDGVQIMDYLGTKMPEALYDQAGALGLYSEDAEVRVHSFAFQVL